MYVCNISAAKYNKENKSM